MFNNIMTVKDSFLESSLSGFSRSKSSDKGKLQERNIFFAPLMTGGGIPKCQCSSTGVELCTGCPGIKCNRKCSSTHPTTDSGPSRAGMDSLGDPSGSPSNPSSLPPRDSSCAVSKTGAAHKKTNADEQTVHGPYPCNLSFFKTSKPDNMSAPKDIFGEEDGKLMEMLDRISDMVTARKQAVESQLFKNTDSVIESLQQKIHALVMKLLKKPSASTEPQVDPNCLETWVEHLIYKRRIEKKLSDEKRNQLLTFIQALVKHWSSQPPSKTFHDIVNKQYLEEITYKEIRPMCEAVIVMLRELVLDKDTRINEEDKQRIQSIYKLLSRVSHKNRDTWKKLGGITKLIADDK